MSLGIVFKGPEGLVLSADSRVTLQFNKPGTPYLSQAFYDDATKVLKVTGQDYVGAITVGLGALGAVKPRTAASFLPELENEIGKNSVRLSVFAFASKLSKFFFDQWTSLMPAQGRFDEMIFIVAGYDENETYGRIYKLTIPSNLTPVEILADDFGIEWDGQIDITQRLVTGLDGNVLSTIQTKFNQSPLDMTRFVQEVSPLSTLRIPYQFLALQDAVDLTILLVKTTAQLQRYLTDIRGVGGPIDVATITRTEGFHWVQHKLIRGERAEQ